MDDPLHTPDPLDHRHPGSDATCPPVDCDLALCVLSSSSGGNCSALVVGRGAARRVFLMDLGLSPRRTRRLLAQVGLGEVPIAGVLVTHLDDDHYAPGWRGALPDTCVQHLHRRHRARAERAGALAAKTSVFDSDFEIAPGTTIRPILQAHDDLGSVSFRIEHAGAGGVATLGFATDLGRASAAWVEHMRGVRVLAIESNYCPRLQARSARPEFMKRRIMGGNGHLSNEQCAEAVARVGSPEHVLLLHLSRECNTPELAASFHANRPYALTIAQPRDPAPWVATRCAKSSLSSSNAVVTRPRTVQKLLFG